MDLTTEERKKKLEAGKEKLAAFRKKKAKQKKGGVKETAASKDDTTIKPVNGQQDLPGHPPSILKDDYSSLKEHNNEEWFACSEEELSSEESESRIPAANVNEVDEVGERESESWETSDRTESIPHSVMRNDENNSESSGDLEKALFQRDSLIGQLSECLQNHVVTPTPCELDMLQQIQTLSQQVTHLQQQLQQTDQTLEEQCRINNISMSALQAAKQQMLQLQLIINNKDIDLQTIAERLSSSQNHISSLQCENDRLSDELSEKARQSEELVLKLEAFDNLSRTQIEMKERESGLENELAARCEELKQLQESEQLSKAALGELRDDNKEKDEKLSFLIEEIEELKKSKSEIEVTAEDLVKANTELRMRCENATASLSSHDTAVTELNKLMEAHMALTSEHESMKSKCALLESVVDQLKEENMCSKSQLEDLNRQLEEQRTAHEDQEKAWREMESRQSTNSDQLNNKLNELQNELTASQEAMSKAEAALNGEKLRVNDLQSQLDESLENREGLKIQVDDLQSQLDKMLKVRENDVQHRDDKIQELEKFIQDYKVSVKELQDVNKRLESRERELLNEMSTFKSELEEKKSENESLSQNAIQLHDELKSMEHVHGVEMSERDYKENNMEDYLESINEDLQSANKRYTELESKMREKESYVENEVKKREELERQVDSLERERNQLRETIQNLNADIGRMKEELVAETKAPPVEEKILAYENQQLSSVLNTEDDDLVEKVQSSILEDEIMSLKDKLDQRESVGRSLEHKFQKMESEYKKRIEKYQTDYASLEENFKLQCSENDSLAEELTELKSAVEETKDELTSHEVCLSAANEELARLKEERARLISVKEEATVRVAELESETEDLKTRIESVQSRDEEMKKNQEEIESQLERTVSEWQKLQQIAQQKELLIQRLEEDRDEIERKHAHALKSHEEELSGLRSDCEMWQGKCYEMDSILDKLRTKCYDLTCELESKSNEISAMLKTVEEKEVTVEGLKCRLSDVNSQMQVISEEKSKKEEMVTQLTTELESVRDEKHKSGNEFDDIKMIITAEKDSLVEKLTESERSLNEAKLTKEELEKRCESLQSQVNDCQTQINDLTSNSERLSQTLAELETRCSDCNDRLSKEQFENSRLSKSLDQITLQNQRLEALLSNVTEDVQEKEAILVQQNANLVAKETEMVNLQEEVNKRDESLKELTENYEKLVLTNKELLSDNQILEEDNKIIAKQVKEIEEKLAEQGQVNVLRTKCYNLISELESKSNEISAMLKTVEEKEVTVEDLKCRLSDVNSQMQVISEEKNKTEEMVTQLTAELESVRDEKHKSGNEFDDIKATITAEKDSLVEKLTESERSLNEAKQMKEELEKRCESLQSQVNDCQTQINDLTSNSERLSQTLAELETRCSDSNDRLSKEQFENSRLSKSLDQITLQNQRLEALLSNVTDDVQEKEAVLVQQNANLVAKETEMTNLQEEVNKRDESLKQSMENYEKLVLVNEELLSDSKILKDNNEAINERVKELGEEVAMREQEAVQLSLDVKQLREEVNQMTQEKELKESSIYDLTHDCEMQKTEIEELKLKLDEKDNEIHNVTSDLTAAQSMLSSMEEEKRMLKNNFDACLEDMQQKCAEQESELRQVKCQLAEETRLMSQGQLEVREMFEAQLAQLEGKLSAVEREKTRLDKELVAAQNHNADLTESYENQMSELELSLQSANSECVRLNEVISKTTANFENEIEDLKSLHEMEKSELMDNNLSLEKCKEELQQLLNERVEKSNSERAELEQSFEVQMMEMDEKRRYYESEVSRLRRHLDEMKEDHVKDLEDVEKKYEMQLFELEDKCSIMSGELERARKSMMSVEGGLGGDERMSLVLKVDHLENVRRELEMKVSVLEDDLSGVKAESMRRENEMKTILENAAERQRSMESEICALTDELASAKADKNSSIDYLQRENEMTVEDLLKRNKHLEAKVKSLEMHVEEDLTLQGHRQETELNENLTTQISDLKKQVSKLFDENLSLKRYIMSQKSSEKKLKSSAAGVEDICSPPLETETTGGAYSLPKLRTSTPSKGMVCDDSFSPTIEDVSLIEGFVAERDQPRFSSMMAIKPSDGDKSEEPDFVAEEHDRFQPEMVIEKALESSQSGIRQLNVHPILEEDYIKDGFQPEDGGDQFFMETIVEPNEVWSTDLSVGTSPSSQDNQQTRFHFTAVQSPLSLSEEVVGHDQEDPLYDHRKTPTPIVDNNVTDNNSANVDAVGTLNQSQGNITQTQTPDESSSPSSVTSAEMERKLSSLREALEEEYVIKMREQKRDLVVEYECKQEKYQSEMELHFSQKAQSIKNDWERKFAAALQKMRRDMDRRHLKELRLARQKQVSKHSGHASPQPRLQEDDAPTTSSSEDGLPGIVEGNEELDERVQQLSRENQELAEARDELLKQIEISQTWGRHHRVQHELQTKISGLESPGASASSPSPTDTLLADSPRRQKAVFDSVLAELIVSTDLYDEDSYIIPCLSTTTMMPNYLPPASYEDSVDSVDGKISRDGQNSSECFSSENGSSQMETNDTSSGGGEGGDIFMTEFTDVSQQSSQDLPLEWELTMTMDEGSQFAEKDLEQHASIWEVFDGRCLRQDCQEVRQLNRRLSQFLLVSGFDVHGLLLRLSEESGLVIPADDVGDGEDGGVGDGTNVSGVVEDCSLDGGDGFLLRSYSLPNNMHKINESFGFRVIAGKSPKKLNREKEESISSEENEQLGLGSQEGSELVKEFTEACTSYIEISAEGSENIDTNTSRALDPSIESTSNDNVVACIVESIDSFAPGEDDFNDADTELENIASDPDSESNCKSCECRKIIQLLKSKLFEKEQEILKLESELADLKQFKLEISNFDIGSIESLRSEVEGLRKEIAFKESTIQNLRADLATLSSPKRVVATSCITESASCDDLVSTSEQNFIYSSKLGCLSASVCDSDQAHTSISNTESIIVDGSQSASLDNVKSSLLSLEKVKVGRAEPDVSKFEGDSDSHLVVATGREEHLQLVPIDNSPNNSQNPDVSSLSKDNNVHNDNPVHLVPTGSNSHHDSLESSSTTQSNLDSVSLEHVVPEEEIPENQNLQTFRDVSSESDQQHAASSVNIQVEMSHNVSVVMNDQDGKCDDVVPSSDISQAQISHSENTEIIVIDQDNQSQSQSTSSFNSTDSSPIRTIELLQSRKNDDNSLSAQNFQDRMLADELIKLQKDLQETREIYSKENNLLQEALNRDEMAKGSLDGRRKRSISANSTPMMNVDERKSLALSTTDDDEVGNLRQRMLICLEQNRMLEEENTLLRARIREQDATVLIIKQKLLEKERSSDEWCRSVNGQLRSLQGQRNDLLQLVRDLESGSSPRVSGSLGHDALKEESLRQAQENLMERMDELDHLHQMLTQRQVELQHCEAERRHLEQLCLLKDQTEIQLMKQKRLMEEQVSEIELRLRERETTLVEEKTRLIRDLREKDQQLSQMSVSARGSASSPIDSSLLMPRSSSLGDLNAALLERLDSSSRLRRHSSNSYTQSPNNPSVDDVDKHHLEAVDKLRRKLKLEYDMRASRIVESQESTIASYWQRHGGK